MGTPDAPFAIATPEAAPVATPAPAPALALPEAPPSADATLQTGAE